MTTLLRRTFVAAMLPVVVWSLAAGSAAAQSTPGATGEISALIRELMFVSEKSGGTADSIAKYFDPNVTITYFKNYTKTWQEYKDHDDSLRTQKATSFEGVTSSHNIGEINVKMHGNVAWAVYPYSATYKTKNGEYTTVGYATMVLTKDTGKWLITHYHISGEAQTPKVAQAPTTPSSQTR